jgi:hypothetical protein
MDSNNNMGDVRTCETGVTLPSFNALSSNDVCLLVFAKYGNPTSFVLWDVKYGNIASNEWKTRGFSRKFNIKPKKKTKYRTPTVKMEGSTCSSGGRNTRRPCMAYSMMTIKNVK